jgi:FtsH-binding integral membrane protein
MDGHGSRVPIWFYIGVLLAIYGAMIFSYGIYEWVSGSYPPLVQLTYLHTPVWWGAMLAALGILYVIKFRPGRAGK